MEYETIADRHEPEQWRVEAINHDSEGEVFVAIFTGSLARERAEEYAAWKNSQERSTKLRIAL